MANEIDVEEHNVFDNPRLRKIFPDIVQLKREIEEGAAQVTTETCGLHRVKQEAATKSTDRQQQASTTDIRLPNATKYNTNLCGDYKVVNENNHLIIEVPSIKREVSEEKEVINYSLKYKAVPKTEMLHCMACSKESKEKMCKQCSDVQENAFPLVSNIKKAPENIFLSKTACDDESGLEQNKNNLQKNIFPDIVKLKKEIDKDKPQVSNETQDLLKVKQEGAIKAKDIQQLTSTTNISLPNMSKYDSDIYGNVKVVNHNTHLIIDIPSIKMEVTEEQITNYKQEYKTVPKNKVTCMVCSKESEDKKRKQCVLESAFPVVNRTMKVPKNTFTYKTASDDESGLEQHKNKRIYSCHFCDYKCLHKSKLIAHLRKHSGEKPYKCELCDYRCTEKGNLNKHIKAKHTNDKNYSCDICEYKCVTKSKLNIHLRKHTGEKPYICEFCDCKFSHSGHLKDHIRAKHKCEKNYSCAVCEYKSVTKSALNVHLRKHTGEKPYKCQFCDYRCSYTGHLKDHIRAKHKFEKNYSCDVCEYKSVTKSALNIHLRKHTGEKPYKCEFCDYRCLVSSFLKNHIKVKHSNETNYSCEICEYRFVTKSKLNVHLQKHKDKKIIKNDNYVITAVQ